MAMPLNGPAVTNKVARAMTAKPSAARLLSEQLAGTETIEIPAESPPVQRAVDPTQGSGGSRARHGDPMLETLKRVLARH